MEHTSKRYQCKRCKHVVMQTTNHYGPTWSWGHFNTCPKCPPWAKYSEFGGSTVWECLDSPPRSENTNPPEVGDRVYFYGLGETMVKGILAERAISPLTGNPRYRVVDLPSEMKDPEAGKWVGVENVYGIFPPS